MDCLSLSGSFSGLQNTSIYLHDDDDDDDVATYYFSNALLALTVDLSGLTS